MGATGVRTPPSKITMALFGTSVVAAIWALAMMTPYGRVAYVYFFAYAEFYVGVISLVALSITLILGLVATDRLVLSIRHRVLMQSAHRTFGIIAVLALALHLWTKLMEAHIGVIDIFIPFLRPYNTLYVGLGTLSAWIMMTVMWTGIIRARFIGRGKPWMWRSIHAVSYLMWPIALVHGLSAGRPAAVWVVVSYLICVLGVLLGLAVRISVSLNRKKDFASHAGTGTGAMKPVGRLVPTTSPAMTKRPGRRPEIEPAAGVHAGAGAPAAVLDRWEPAPGARTPAPPVGAQRGPIGAPPAMTGPPPISAPPYDEEPYRRGVRPRRAAEPDQRPHRGADGERPTRSRRAVEDEYAVPRGRRYTDGEDVAAPRRSRTERPERYEPDERFDEQTQTISRRAIASGRRRFDDVDDAPPPRSRRQSAEEPRYEAPGYAGYETPSHRTPSYQTPSYQTPSEQTPSYQTPSYEPPGYRTPSYPNPSYQTPGYQTPGYGPESRPRARRYAEEAPPAARRARAEIQAPPARRDAVQEPPAPPARRYADPEPGPAPRARRYADEERQPGRRHPEEPPRARRDRAGVDRADSGRHSRSEFVDLADPGNPEPDETPTLVDMASRRARKAAQEPGRGARRAARRGRGRKDDGADDEMYWRVLRGEAQ
jgi:hypothetical protein